MCPPRATSGLVDDRRGPISTSVIEPDVAQHVSTDGAPGSYPGRFAFRPRRRRSAPEIDTGSLPTRRCVGERDLSMTPGEEPHARSITTPIIPETEPVPGPPSAVLLIVRSVTTYGAIALGLPTATVSGGASFRPSSQRRQRRVRVRAGSPDHRGGNTRPAGSRSFFRTQTSSTTTKRTRVIGSRVTQPHGPPPRCGGGALQVNVDVVADASTVAGLFTTNFIICDAIRRP